MKYEEYAAFFELMFDPDGDKRRLEEFRKKFPAHAGDNTSIADYVWLPLRFAEPDAAHPLGMVYIDWLDEWRIEDYD